jgi:serine/threonine protein kinase
MGNKKRHIDTGLNDIWALGTIFFILLSGGKHPFLNTWQEGDAISAGNTNDENGVRKDKIYYYKRLIDKSKEKKPADVGSSIQPLKELVSSMLSIDPKERPDALKVCQELKKIVE